MLFAMEAHAQTADSGAQDDFLFWGKLGWIGAVALAGLVIWYFKGRRKPPPE
jgi:hypothetical protein